MDFQILLGDWTFASSEIIEVKLPKSANLRLRKQKIWQKNGKICKNHEEKHEIDVKENEKSGEMRGFATPKQGMRDPKQGMRG